MDRNVNDPQGVQSDSEPYEFREVDDLDPLELVGNAHLALHHHMAPARALEDSDFEEEFD